ncbi:MAG: hypothetical protein AAF251_06355 [Pseudomonadota bacterium]
MINGVEPYEAREFAFVEATELGGIDFKIYTIARTGASDVSPALLRNAYSYIETVLPEVRKEEGPDHGLGYVILHAGQMSNWLLIHWWAHSDIALRLLASAELGTDVFVSHDHKRFHACVWEHVVIDHERLAWVRQAMSATGSASNYQSDRLADGRY